MNESIDLTLTKVFLKKLDNGQRAQLDDEHHYLMKYGEEGGEFSQRSEMLRFLDSFNVDRFAFFQDKIDRRYSEHYEDALYKILDKATGFGYGFGTGNNCDCCGIELNLLNKSPYFMCNPCNEDNKYRRDMIEDGEFFDE